MSHKTAEDFNPHRKRGRICDASITGSVYFWILKGADMAHAIWMYSACAAMLLPASGVRAILPDLMINRLPGLENNLPISVKDCNNLSLHFR